MNRRTYLFLGSCVSAAVLVAATTIYFNKVRQIGLYSAKNHQIAQKMRNLDHEPPKGIPQHDWQELVTLTVNAFCNVCFHPSHVPYDEMVRFEKDLDRKLASDKPATVETLSWIWYRLAETGPKGKEYIERMTPVFEECMKHLRPKVEQEPISEVRVGQ